jgi:hypothetical protein
MTLLVLDLKLPPHQVGRLLHGLLAQWPAYVSFCASFLFIAVISRVRSVPISAAFVAAIRHGTLATRPHILTRLGPPLTTSVEVFVHWKVNSTLP